MCYYVITVKLKVAKLIIKLTIISKYRKKVKVGTELETFFSYEVQRFNHCTTQTQHK